MNSVKNLMTILLRDTEEKLSNLFNKYNPDKTFYILGQPIVIEPAPEPSDVYWEN